MYDFSHFETSNILNIPKVGQTRNAQATISPDICVTFFDVVIVAQLLTVQE
jgi:hypothetical protein